MVFTPSKVMWGSASSASDDSQQRPCLDLLGGGWVGWDAEWLSGAVRAGGGGGCVITGVGEHQVGSRLGQVG